MTTLLGALSAIMLTCAGGFLPTAASATEETSEPVASETEVAPFASAAQCREWKLRNPTLFRKYCL